MVDGKEKEGDNDDRGGIVINPSQKTKKLRNDAAKISLIRMG